MLNIITSKIILEELKKLNSVDKQLIIDEILNLQKSGSKNDKHIDGEYGNKFKRVIGDYKIIYQIEKDILTIALIKKIIQSERAPFKQYFQDLQKNKNDRFGDNDKVKIINTSRGGRISLEKAKEYCTEYNKIKRLEESLSLMKEGDEIYEVDLLSESSIVTIHCREIKLKRNDKTIDKFKLQRDKGIIFLRLLLKKELKIGVSAIANCDAKV